MSSAGLFGYNIPGLKSRNNDKTAGANRDMTVIVIDDDPFVLDYVTVLLKEHGYEVHAFGLTKEAIAAFENIGPSVVLTDIRMPGMTGIELLERFRTIDPDIPVVLMTAYPEIDATIEAIKNGAFDFVVKPFKPEYLIHSIEKASRYSRLIRMEKNYKTMLEETVQQRTSELENALKTIRRMSKEVIQRLTAVAEFRDTHTGAHISRIGLYSNKIAEFLDMPSDFVEAISFSSGMHDIGKIGIPDRILLKESSLTPEEFEIMKSHTTMGERMLSGSSLEELKLAASIALNHHERWDGTGYPRGLKGEEIPIEGRIVLVCDQYDALMSKRPYKASFEHEEVVKIITQGDGRTMPGHFDPVILDAFKRISHIFKEIFISHQD